MRVPLSVPPATDGVRTVVEIAASPEAVFNALSDPRELAAWLGGSAAPSGDRAPHWGRPSMPIIGQPWSAPALRPDGSVGSVRGEYLLVDPPRCLESTWRASWDGFSPDRVRFDLTRIDVGGGIATRLTVTHTRASAHLEVTASAGMFGRGEWPTLLARLASYLTSPVAGRVS
jgi:uncharacterized protein YndB with AHSA1/START domain